MTKTLRSMLFKFKYLRKLLDTYHLRIIYFALVESRIQYAVLSWGGVAATHLKKFETMQKRILKIMYRKEPTFSSNLLFVQARIFDVRQIFFNNILTHIHKNKNLLNNIDHEHFTRKKKNITLKLLWVVQKLDDEIYFISFQKFLIFYPLNKKMNINSRHMLKKNNKKICS